MLEAQISLRTLSLVPLASHPLLNFCKAQNHKFITSWDTMLEICLRCDVMLLFVHSSDINVIATTLIFQNDGPDDVNMGSPNLTSSDMILVDGGYDVTLKT